MYFCLQTRCFLLVQLQAQLYKEDFASERSDRENAHEKLADLEEKHAEEVGKLTAKLLQMEEAGKHKGKKLVMVKIVLCVVCKMRLWDRL